MSNITCFKYFAAAAVRQQLIKDSDSDISTLQNLTSPVAARDSTVARFGIFMDFILI